MWDMSVAVAPPIVTSAVYRMNGVREQDGLYIYHRYGNPSLRSLEKAISQIEGAKFAACFNTGDNKFIYDQKILGKKRFFQGCPLPQQL